MSACYPVLPYCMNERTDKHSISSIISSFIFSTICSSDIRYHPTILAYYTISNPILYDILHTTLLLRPCGPWRRSCLLHPFILLPLSLSLSLSLLLFLSFIPLSLSHTHTHTHSLSLSLSLSRAESRVWSISFSALFVITVQPVANCLSYIHPPLSSLS